jgi:short-subunit dehydrogenase
MLFTRVVDLTDKKAVEQLAIEIIAKHGSIDGLINNAGIIQPFVKLNELGYEVIDRVFNVNFLGTLYMTKSFLPHFLSRPEAHIVNIASMGGFLPVPGQTIYCASKAAVKLLTEGLDAELTNTNVRVSIVFPGAMNTNIMANSGLGGSKASSAEKNSTTILSPAVAAEKIIKGIEQNKSRMLIGADSKMMDFLYRINPKFASRLIYKQMKAKLSI